MGTTRANSCHYCPGWVTGLWLVLGILALFFIGAGRQGAPAEDRPRPPAAKGAVSIPAAPPARASRPRGPAYRVDNGLGSPMARLRQSYDETG